MEPGRAPGNLGRSMAGGWAQMSNLQQQQQQPSTQQQPALQQARASLSSASSSSSSSLEFKEVSAGRSVSACSSSGPLSEGLGRPNQARAPSNPLAASLNPSTSGTSATTSSSSTGGGAPGASAGTGSSDLSLVSASERSLPAAAAPLGSMLNPMELVAAGGQQQQVSGATSEEENRRLRLQLYVLVSRCISYSFNAKPQNIGQLQHRQQLTKLSRQQLAHIVQAHSRYISSPGSFAPAKCPHQHLKLPDRLLRRLDELYERAQLSFNRKFLADPRLGLLVDSHCCSQQDVRDLFRQSVEQTLANSGLFSGEPCVTPPSALGAADASGNPTSGAATLEPDSSQLLAANRDVIINSWLIKFESIMHAAAGELAADTPGPLEPAAHVTTPGGGGGGAQNELSMSKEQLYQLFQTVLNIKKFEHQLLYNALQLDSADEQAAAVRRELDGRVARLADMERNKRLMPKFVLKEMESLYLEEARAAVNKLMVNLDNLSLNKGAGSSSTNDSSSSSRSYGLQKFRRYNNRLQASLTRDGLVEGHLANEPALTKLDVLLTFNIEVVLLEVRGLRQLVAPSRLIYCTMEIEGSEKLQTEHVAARKPAWDTQGDFTTNHPLPVLKVKLFAVNQSMLALEDKELGRLVLRPSVLSPKTPEWWTMQASASSLSSAAQAALSEADSSVDQDTCGGPSMADDNSNELKIRLVVRMDRPQQLKHCGHLWGSGKSTWRKLKRRYHILIQVSQYTFVMCSYKDKKAKPTEMLQLAGYTVDYIEPPTDLIMEHCSEVSLSDHHAHHHHHHSSNHLGLAGMLANAVKTQLRPSSSSGGGASSDSQGGAGGTDQSSGAGGNPNSGSGDHSTNGEPPSAIQTAAALSDELHSKFYFNVVREGDSVIFACDDEQECHGWVMALYRATGQAHKPTPQRDQYSGSLGSAHYVEAAFAYQASASQPTKLVGSSLITSSLSSIINGGSSRAKLAGADGPEQRARKHGMDEFISADPCKLKHNQLFSYLQNETLRHRLREPYCSMGWLSSRQVFVLDEYCARYGVRSCYRHLAYLSSLLDFNQFQGHFIDHTLLNYGYDFCASHVSGHSGQAHPLGSVNFDWRPDGLGTVTVEERDLFHAIKTRMLKMIERQISNFSYCFPFGKPDGALKAALSLLERLLMKQEHHSGPTMGHSMLHNEEVRQLIKKCLEQAALTSYTKLSSQANLADCLLAPVSSGREPAGAPLMLANNNNNNNNQCSMDSATNGPSAGSEIGAGSGASRAAASASQVLATASETIAQGARGLRQRALSNLSSSSIGSSSMSSTVSGARADSLGAGRQYHQHPHHQSSMAANSARSPSPDQSPGRLLGPSQQQQQQPEALPHQRAPLPAGAGAAAGQHCLSMASVIQSDQLRPRDKLRCLIRLAELCCQEVELNNDYFGEAFAWHSDLMVEHFELFWSLFSVDMDRILGELATSSSSASAAHQQRQPTSSGPGAGPLLSQRSASLTGQTSSDLLGASGREVFQLFQVLNNHLRRPQLAQCRKFKAYLCDTFKPRLMLYIDVMESSMTRMLFKACEREGKLNCHMVEQMFNRLEEMQRFVLYQLRWPEEQLAEQLHQRLKLMAYELCEASIRRTLMAFQQLERRSGSMWTASSTANYLPPVEMVHMINLVLETRNRSLTLCTFNNFDQMSYHSKTDKLAETALAEMQPGLLAKMVHTLEATLAKLSRYDEGNLLAPILSLTYKQGMSASGRDIGKQFVNFLSNTIELIRLKINDELWILNLLEDCYATQMNIICNWLSDRLDHSLHGVQLFALSTITPKVYADMLLQGLPEEKLNLKTYQTVMNRLKMEEAAALAGGSLFEQPTRTSIFNSSRLSSLTSTSSHSGQSVASGGGAGAGTNAQGSLLAATGATSLTGSHRPTSQQAAAVAPLAAATATTRRGVPTSSGQHSFGEQQVQGNAAESSTDNIADRALQSASRMFKGFWTG